MEKELNQGTEDLSLNLDSLIYWLEYFGDITYLGFLRFNSH